MKKYDNGNKLIIKSIIAGSVLGIIVFILLFCTMDAICKDIEVIEPKHHVEKITNGINPNDFLVTP